MALLCLIYGQDVDVPREDVGVVRVKWLNSFFFKTKK